MPAAFAQPGQGDHGGGMMTGDVPDDIKVMMHEPSKALAQASVQCMTVFTRSLHTQVAERRASIDDACIEAAFAEMKRACGMINRFLAGQTLQPRYHRDGWFSLRYAAVGAG